ncbi:MAG: Rieske (2Fe-2S) protein [Gammaproteobacteria bacterium]
MNLIRLCNIADLSATGAKSCQLTREGAARELFVVRKGAEIFAYENHCPHTGGPLDWMPDRFLDEDGELIVCATHAALFRINDGRCIAGPCAGAHLTAVAITVQRGEVFLNE